MLDIDAITSMHRETVCRWHEQEIDNPYEGFVAIACRQASFNFRLWHEEDIARSPDVADTEIARVKRAIDRLNQQRNDAIEELDDWIGQQLEDSGVQIPADAPMNTETPGSVIDRLSILALRIYHLEEQLQRDDVGDEHICSVRAKLSVCHHQQGDLADALKQLVIDLAAGRKRHRTYRQYKMYNDPSLNPYLYASGGSRSELGKSAVSPSQVARRSWSRAG